MAKRAEPVIEAEPIAPAWPADDVQRWPVASLVASVRNARVHSPEQVKQIARSISEFGFTIPLLVDENGVLIAGHGRALAAQSLGLKDVPTMVARGWTQKQINAYRIADNKLALNSMWDEALLETQLQELSDDGITPDLLGFDALKYLT